MSVAATIAAAPNRQSFDLPSFTAFTQNEGIVTVMAWIRRDESPAATQQFFVWDVNPGSNSRFEWQLDSTYHPQIFARAPDAGVGETATSTSTIALDVWTHIAIVVDVAGDEIRFYKDGVLTDTVVVAFTNVAFDNMPTGNDSVMFDNVPTGAGSQPWGGACSRLRGFNRELTDEEIQSDFHGGGWVTFGTEKWYYDCGYGVSGNTPADLRDVGPFGTVTAASVNSTPRFETDGGSATLCPED